MTDEELKAMVGKDEYVLHLPTGVADKIVRWYEAGEFCPNGHDKALTEPVVETTTGHRLLARADTFESLGVREMQFFASARTLIDACMAQVTRCAARLMGVPKTPRESVRLAVFTRAILVMALRHADKLLHEANAKAAKEMEHGEAGAGEVPTDDNGGEPGDRPD